MNTISANSFPTVQYNIQWTIIIKKKALPLMVVAEVKKNLIVNQVKTKIPLI